MTMNKLLSAFTLALTVTALFLLSGCIARSPEDTAKQYWEAVMAGDETKAKSLTLAPTKEGLETFIQPADGSQVEFGDTTLTDDTAAIATSLTWADDEYDTTFQIDTILKKSDNEWKVDAEATRKVFISAVYNSTLNGLQQAFEETATEFRRLGEELLGTVATELTEASRELQEGAEEAKVEIEKFLKQIDQNLVEELKKHGSPPPPDPVP
ncbi:MAG: hypothetical protein ACRBCS_05950 [Cellvibrionaceae bacterium]